MTGAEIVIQCLIEQGVDSIFGYPGGTILNIYDELYKNQDKIKHYLTSHEQGASHAADGYARATGKVGVCFATSGPGATNLVTGLATAYMDSIPVVAITCNVAKNLLGRDSFQEVDIAGITMPITKHNCIVGNVNELADIIREAFYIAKSGRPGPVLIDIPKDITVHQCDYEYEEPKAYVPQEKFTDSDIEHAVELINNAKKPYIISGGGVVAAGACEQIKELADKLNCPVCSTLMGIGTYPTDAESYMGMLGMHGTKASNIGVNESDLVIAIGVRFSDRVTSDASKFAKKANILHIDIDNAELKKNVKIKHGIQGDAKLVLNKILPSITQNESYEWLDENLARKQEFPHMDSPMAPLNPEFILNEICDATNGNAVLTTEVGQHQMWTAQFGTFKEPRTLVTSGGLGTMGFGTGASMGACVGVDGKKRVIAIAGDGSFRMNCNELSTMQYYNLPVIIVIMNNHTLGMVRQWQTLFYDKRYSQTTLDRGPDFKKLAEAYYIDGYDVSTKEAFQNALLTALSKDKPALINANVNIDHFVLPMVAPGTPIQKLISSVNVDED